MRVIGTVLACIAIASFTRRVKTSLEQNQASSETGEASQWLVDKQAASGSNLVGVQKSRLQQNVRSLSPLRKLAFLLLALNPATAFKIPGASHSLAPPQRRNYGQAPVLTRNDQQVVMQAEEDIEKEQIDGAWQIELDKATLSGICELYEDVLPDVCDIDLEEDDRMESLKEALRDPVFIKDVNAALATFEGKGSMEWPLETLFPQGSESRADLFWLIALRKNVPEAFEELSKHVLKQVETREEERQRELKEEANELLRKVPEELETPTYEVVHVLEVPNILSEPCPIEIRDYKKFTVARTHMRGGVGSASEGEGFNALAAYRSGQNQPKTAMALTVPLDIFSSADNSEASMSIVLPLELARTPPSPLEGSNVEIVKVPARLVATKAFSGEVTDLEVEHQIAVILEALAIDGDYSPASSGQVSVLRYSDMKMSGVDTQYEEDAAAALQQNTMWRRRNEVAIVVSPRTLPEAKPIPQIPSWSEGRARMRATDGLTSTSFD